MIFLNPFKLHDQDAGLNNASAVVPMDQAPRHPLNVLRAKKVMGASANSLNSAEVGKTSDSSSFIGFSDHAPSTNGVFSIESLRREVEDDIDSDAAGIDTIYDRKSGIINIAIQDIGMGRYNWQLFALCGFGWLCDNLYLQGVGIILTSLQREFGVPDNKIGYTTMSVFIGLCIGAVGWGISADIVGRRIAFNSTLFIAGAFGLCLGATPNWIAVCAILAVMGTGIGGSLPVDGALFLEFLPHASGNMLTMLSVWWPCGQLLASLVAWIFIPNYSCAESEGCTKGKNMGWRYTMFTLGAITFLMFIGRFFIFHLLESPKFLLSKGKDREAVAAVQGIALKNKTKTWLTYEILQEVGGDTTASSEKYHASSLQAVAKRKLQKFSSDRIKPLFGTKKLGITTALVWYCWASIGMAFPLFNAFLVVYLSKSADGEAPKSNAVVFRNYAITSLVGIPGSVLACYTVDLKYVGRKGTLAISTMLTGIFICLFTLSSDSNYQLALTSVEAFVQNISYGVLYAYSPEVFPAPNRGTATGIASFLNRITGLCAPIIATNTIGGNPKTPIYASAGLFLSAFIAMVLLPIETRGRQSL